MSKRPSSTGPDQSATESADGDPFLSRWARRKRAARAGGDADAVAGEAGDEKAELVDTGSGDGTLPQAGEDDQQAALTDADMPPVDTIDEDTDMSGFFSPKVSQAVKQAALKKFFHSPMFNIVDGLDDYDDDFRNFEALGDIITSDMRSQMEREAKRVREAAAKDAESSESAAPEEIRAEGVDEVDEADDVDKADEVAAVDDEPAAASDEPAAQQLAGAETGVTREPGDKPGAGRGKLRPKGVADDQR